MNKAGLKPQINRKLNRLGVFFTKYIEPKKILRIIELSAFFLLLIGSVALFLTGGIKVGRKPKSWTFEETVEMIRNAEAEDYDEDSTVCDVIYETADGTAFLIVSYTYEEWLNLEEDHTIEADVYLTDNSERLYFVHRDRAPTRAEVYQAAKTMHAGKYSPLFSLATSLLILGISLSVILFFAKVFTLYEKLWFISIMVLATVVSIILPEESANGVSGIVIMLLYLLDTFFNILCELLISKQSRWNFIVSVVVEILEILICI
ncbi:MAG TPA: nicotinamide mononucleotide transporter PnuC, partial [Bacilli bacterium]|nr:nicotinamide mononucleotide transporter PnuC [Bacilli bacterium]